MQRQIKETEVYWESSVPVEYRIESRRNVRLRELIRDAAGATTDIEEEAERLEFMELFDHLNSDTPCVLEWCQG